MPIKRNCHKWDKVIQTHELHTNLNEMQMAKSARNSDNIFWPNTPKNCLSSECDIWVVPTQYPWLVPTQYPWKYTRLFYFSLFPTWYTVYPSTYNICYLLSSTCFRPHRPIIRRSKLYMQPVVFSPSADVFVMRPLSPFSTAAWQRCLQRGRIP